MTRITLLIALLAATIAATPTGSNPSGGSGPMSEPAMPAAPPPMTSNSNPQATPNPAMLAAAKSAFSQLQTGTIDRSTLTTQMNNALTDDKLATVKGALGSMGAPTSFVQQGGGVQGADNYGVYLVTFANGTRVQFTFAQDAQGKISGMQLKPVQ